MKAPRKYYKFLIPFKGSPLFKLMGKAFNLAPKEEMLVKTMEFVKCSRIKGDYYEFGVWDGHSFAFAYHAAKASGLDDMDFYAFDSFEGLPEPKGIDKNFTKFKKEDYKCTLDNFKKNLKTMKVNMNKVKIIKGWFDKVLNKDLKKRSSSKSASVILIDCDLYKSTVPVLNFIKDYIVDGTVLLFDDWFCFKADPNLGQQKAVNQWLKKNKNITLSPFHNFDWHGKSFIVSKKK